MTQTLKVSQIGTGDNRGSFRRRQEEREREETREEGGRRENASGDCEDWR